MTTTTKTGDAMATIKIERVVTTYDQITITGHTVQRERPPVFQVLIDGVLLDEYGCNADAEEGAEWARSVLESGRDPIARYREILEMRARAEPREDD